MEREEILAEMLKAVLSELARVMGPAAVFGISGRACHTVLEEHWDRIDWKWLERALPPELFQNLVPLRTASLSGGHG